MLDWVGIPSSYLATEAVAKAAGVGPYWVTHGGLEAWFAMRLGA